MALFEWCAAFLYRFFHCTALCCAGTAFGLLLLLLLQNRMQRCAMDCADEAKDTIPAGAKEGDAVVERAMAQVRRPEKRQGRPPANLSTASWLLVVLVLALPPTNASPYYIRRYIACSTTAATPCCEFACYAACLQCTSP